MKQIPLFFSGIRPYDFTDEKSGKHLSGVTVWLVEEDENAHGLIPVKCSLTNEEYERVFAGFDVDTPFQPVNAVFNHKGRLQHISLAK